MPVYCDKILLLLKSLPPANEKMKRGIPIPMTYTIVTHTIAAFMRCVAARVAIVASIGPAQGVHTTPSAAPVSNPVPKSFPSLLVLFPNIPLNLLTHPSSKPLSEGIRRVRPKKPIIMTATKRKILGSKGIIFTIYDSERVKKAKLTMTPIVMPNAFFFPPVVEDDKTIGSIGQIHGAKMVTRPERKAKSSKTVMIKSSFY